MYIKVRVTAAAKREIVTEESVDHYRVSVKEEAEMNMANKRILAIFRERFPAKSVRMISGHHSPSKILAVD